MDGKALKVADIISALDRSEQSRIMFEPVEQMIPGIRNNPGNFVILGYNDPELGQILDYTVKNISAYDNKVVIRI